MIDKNNIPVGYKDSPVGIIPQEWEVKTFGEIGIFSKGSGISRSEANTGNIPCVRYGELYTHHHNFIKIYNSFISKEVAANSKLLKYGDILFAATGETKGEIGKSVVFIDKIEAYAGGDIIIVSPDFKLSDSLYMGYLSNSISVIRQKATRGQGDAIVHITSDAIKNILIPLPPLAEQKKIAEILCTWDDAIEKQSKLIEKLELRKRGLMQRLLTGKTRLPGFTEPWKKIKLGEICKRVTRKNEEKNQNVMTISAQKGFVSQTDFFNKTVASSTLDNYYLVHKDEFCYNKSYSNGYPMGAIKRLKDSDKAVVTTLYICFSIADNKSLDINFFEQYCENGGFNKVLIKVANEGGRAHGLLNVTPSDFFGLSIILPILLEQKAIASILSAADKEIETQRKKLEALRQQKQGLMQQLLTGKTRVKVS